MKKVFISLIVMLMIIGLSAPIMDVFALDDLADAEAGPYNDPNQEITSINEDGTIVDETIVETSISTQNDSSSKESANRYARDANGITSNSTAVVNFRTKSNASINTEYKEDGTNRAGYVNGYYAADAAFLGFDNDTNPTKVKFLQAGVIGWVNYSEVDVYNYTDSRVNTTSKYYVSNGRLYHGIVTNLASNGYSSSLDCGPKPSYLQEGKTYFSYDGHYFYTYDTNNLTNAYAKMLNDYRNNVRTNAINANDPYYNYYLYLSHRSVTEYSASELNEAIANFSKSTSKMRNLGQCFIDNQNLYGANALLMIGVAANESAWGSSNIAMTKNNLFGHAAYDSDPNGSANGYSSVEYSVYYHAARFVSKGYLDCITDSRYYGSFLGDKASGMAVKYASDPYWGEKAAAMAWKVDSYLGGKDAKKYTIAIKDTIPSGHSVIDIKSLPSSSSTTLYKTYPVSSKTTYKSYAPSNYAFIVLEDGQTNGYYKIQCDSEVNSSRTAIINQEAYTFANSYGYIPTNSVRIVSKGSNSTSEVDKNTSNVEGESTGKGAGEPTLYYQSNVKYYGWLDEVNEPNTTGTTGQSLDLYQLKLRLENVPDGAVISARIFENEKWINYDSIDSNTVIGNANVPIQKISFTLTGLSRYKLQYRVHSTDIDWQAWVDAGTETGTAGKNIQAIDFRLVADDTKPIIYYQSNVQNCGWLDEVRDSNTTGTTGQSLGLYQLKIKLINVDSKTYLSGKVYTNEQWLDYDHINQDTILGNSNTTMEKVSFDLNGLANYKLQYRVHSADVGWQDWTNSGNETGTAGKRIEAIEFRLIDEEPVYIKDITLNKSSITLNKGKNETLEATISPDDTTEDKTVTWTTGNKNVATVDQTGKVTAVDAGTTTITATASNGKTAICKVSVLSPITSVSLNKKETTIQKSGSETLQATINPSNTTEDKTLTWTSSNTKVATVDKNGKVTAVAEGNCTITVKTANGKTAACQVTVVKQIPSVVYQTHVENIGWQDIVKDGQIAGITGQSKRLEAIKIDLKNDESYDGSIEYRTHIQDIGWESSWTKNGNISGTSGQSKRLEAIQIRLTGEMAEEYDIYYRVHAQEFGWLDWAKNGESAGTAGYSYRLEAIEIKLVKKGEAAPGKTEKPYIQHLIGYSTHVQDIGWQGMEYDGNMSGTTGQSKRLEAINIVLQNPQYEGDVEYKTHIQDIGWESSWTKNGNISGTSGQSKRLEAIQIRLTGEMAKKYDIYYRVHAEDYGWLGWAKNGESAGTEGLSKRLEAIEIKLVKKGETAPGSTENSFIK